MRRVEVGPAQPAEVASGGVLDEIQRARDPVHDHLVGLRLRRVIHPVQVPVLGVMQVGKTAVHQRANEIERQRGALVAAQQQPGVRLPVARGKRFPVDQVAPETRQRHLLARLQRRRARLGVLPRHAPDPHDGLAQPVAQHQAHLQQHLQPANDDVGGAFLEGLGAVAPLQHEALAALRLRDGLSQRLDLPAGHDGRQRGQFLQRRVQRFAVPVFRLLLSLAREPAVRTPLVRRLFVGQRESHDQPPAMVNKRFIFRPPCGFTGRTPNSNGEHPCVL